MQCILTLDRLLVQGYYLRFDRNPEKRHLTILNKNSWCVCVCVCMFVCVFALTL